MATINFFFLMEEAVYSVCFGLCPRSGNIPPFKFLVQRVRTAMEENTEARQGLMDDPNKSKKITK